jgi:hypothetical protein
MRVFNLLSQRQILNMREYLGLLYISAKIDEINGDINKVKEKFKVVAETGNTLWIASQARQYLEKI